MSKHPSSIRKTLIVALVIAVASVGLVGDADARNKKSKTKAQKESDAPELLQLMWPEPPETPRIKALQTYSTEKHLGRKPTRRESFVQWFAGAAPPRAHVYQPMDVAVSDDGKRFYVADFGQLVVFVFDFETKSVKRIGENRPFIQPAIRPGTGRTRESLR